ncbi:hypothetical protein Enr13x_47890 [Stieleria neptunia]|uniref:Uncharacterized protein n=1 Tax=Stieleria neptunia TaxID=2527979 RepID=A0A518HVP5_9BACT|nr:hypothetical protein Enr13x_47890 [Stieleria neptunia]
MNRLFVNDLSMSTAEKIGSVSCSTQSVWQHRCVRSVQGCLRSVQCMTKDRSDEAPVNRPNA